MEQFTDPEEAEEEQRMGGLEGERNGSDAQRMGG